ncbi:short-chain dehydrogenase [Marinobacter psychrophilus]|jgi:meso-butanediol dehydrogenase/(S,S)-butanediol dehydrogenase/diacetyl reductase|uniref:Short-chain dehydrogenase n=1 Tax=Marinobacter psychrophilus TaxID=330734 RepID=A0A0H4I6T5_9GAMM|nr:SDR family NAD(P)-dependent oxidoreductase [Marinobacter psychrophilus]AKO53455.1 short-chain dehydrogenase [Marinobacter psychrophilus]
MILEGKTALITGAGRGIGQGIAMSLAEAGANIVAADLDINIARQTAEKVQQLGRKSLALEVDVTDPDSIHKMMQQAEEQMGPIDIAVNNAGILSIHPIAELSANAWDQVMNVNARGVFLCTQAELAVMRPRKFGRIINIASIAGKVGFPNLSHYSASKFAVIGFTNAVAKEVAAEGVTVNALCPGIVGTGMWRGPDGLSAAWAQDGESEEESWERHQKTLLPQGEAQTPEDMGQLAVYLASAAHVTGQAIAVDGGFSL